MAWDHVPPDSGDDIQSWWWIKQFWDALRQRGYCISQSVYFARVANTWDSGIITGATRTSLSDSSKTWRTDRWIDNNGVPDIPDQYDVVIYDPDFRQIQRMHIEGNTATTLSFAETDWYDPSIYIGKRYLIITGWGPQDSPWLQERMPLGPNDRPLDAGLSTSGTASTLDDTAKQWQAGFWVGKHVVIEDGSRNRRAVITGNTATQLTFTGQGWNVAAGQRYVIVDPDAVYEFTRIPDPIYAWCGSPTEPWLTHSPEDDGITSTLLPYMYASLPGHAEPVQVFDADVWTQIEDDQDTPDKCYTPKVFNTIRGLQLACEMLCQNFVEPVDHTGRNALDNWTVPRFFEYLGINTASATVASVDIVGGTTSFSPGIAGMFLEDNQTVQITCVEGYKVIWTRTASLNISANATQLNFAVNEDDPGRRLIFAFGWTRYLPREFIRFYRQTVFVPDIDLETFEPALVPTEQYPGTWESKGPSTSYKGTSDLGFVGESSDSHDVITDGDLARYSGQNWNDPTLGIKGSDISNPLAQLRNTYYVGKKSPDWKFGDKGMVSAGGTWWLRDDSKNWWNHVLVEHTGTASAGSSTSLTDSAKSTDGFWTTTNRGRFADHILEITSGPHAGMRVPIDSQAGVMLGFRDIGFSTAGLDYRIREPAYELNRWQQRVLRVTKDDGTVLPDIPVTHSDDNTLYFAALDAPVQAGWTYELIEVSTGTVWLREAGKWVLPPPETYGKNQFAVRPTVVRRYGRYMKGDYLTILLFQELQQAINAMKHIAIPFGWTAFPEPWHDTPLALGKAYQGGDGYLTDFNGNWIGDLTGKDIQIRTWLTGAMARYTITGNDSANIYFDGTAGFNDDYWVLDPSAHDVAPNDVTIADTLGSGNQNDWTSMYGQVHDDWISPRYPDQRPHLSDNKAPRCYTRGSDYQGYQQPGVYYYSPELDGTQAYGRADIPYCNWDGSIFSVQCDFYNFADYPQPRQLPEHEATFIANGEQVQFERWVKFDTRTSRTDGNPTMSRKFNDVATVPAAGPAPPPPPDPDGSTIYDTANGYVIAEAKVVMRYETSGLLTFL